MNLILPAVVYSRLPNDPLILKIPVVASFQKGHLHAERGINIPGVYKPTIIWLDFLVDFCKPVFSKVETKIWQVCYVHHQFLMYIKKDLSFSKLSKKIKFPILESLYFLINCFIFLFIYYSY